jgi:hypothetical protein
MKYREAMGMMGNGKRSSLEVTHETFREGIKTR